MENPLINHLIDFPLKPHAAAPIRILTSDGSLDHGGSSIDDIEMISLQNMNYTSLKDLMPASPPASISPTNGSWREIPIKDPLVQHAAWAYLQPMAEARDEDEKWWRRLQKTCCGMLGCLNDVALAMFRGYGSGKID